MKYIILLILLFIIQPSKAASPAELLIEANEAYSRSEYAHAAELYEKILEQNMVSPDLYYNLGNAYYKNNMLGPAILNYERAMRLKPMDEDIIHNLRIAQNKTIDRIEQRPMLFYERWWLAAWTLQGIDGWAVSSIIFIIILLSVASVYLFSRNIIVKKTSFYSMLLLFVVVVFSLIFTRKHYNKLTNQKEAIVMQTRVTAKSSPSLQSPDLFLLHEGTKVNIRSTLGQWSEISLPNGNVGWIRDESLETI